MASFLKTKVGKMTLAFIIIMLGFITIMIGISTKLDGVIQFGFLLVVTAMLYSPIDVLIVKYYPHQGKKIN